MTLVDHSPDFDQSSLTRLRGMLGEAGAAEIIDALVFELARQQMGVEPPETDARALQRRVHDLKACCNILDAKLLAALFAEVEKQLIEGDTTVALNRLPALFNRYEQLVMHTRGALHGAPHD